MGEHSTTDWTRRVGGRRRMERSEGNVPCLKLRIHCATAGSSMQNPCHSLAHPCTPSSNSLPSDPQPPRPCSLPSFPLSPNTSLGFSALTPPMPQQPQPIVVQTAQKNRIGDHPSHSGRACTFVKGERGFEPDGAEEAVERGPVGAWRRTLEASLDGVEA
jgi:hypothetical protein